MTTLTPRGLALWRFHKRMSQQSAAAYLFRARVQYARYESGKAPIPPLVAEKVLAELETFQLKG